MITACKMCDNKRFSRQPLLIVISEPDMRAVAIAVIVLASVLITFAQTTPPEVADLKTKAAAGDVRAQVALGHAYEDGAGTPQNDEQAVRWYRAAADHGNAQAQNDLGVMYRLGHGVPKDFAEAAKWFRKAAKQGYGPAMFNLATIYYNGDGVAIDDKAAYAWFVLAEQAGSTPAADGVQRLTSDMPAWKLRDAKVLLAAMLLKGELVHKDTQAGVALYSDVAREAPELWVPLAKLYIFNNDLPHDYKKAEQYCTTAADAGFTSGMDCLGYLYGTGLLGPDRDKEAFTWYDKAARLGNTTAWYGLGVMHYYGRGTKQDIQEAYKWLFLANSAHVPHAEELFASASPQISAKAEKLKRKAWEEQAKTYDKKTRLPEIHALSDGDLNFLVVVEGPPVHRPN